MRIVNLLQVGDKAVLQQFFNSTRIFHIK